MREKETRLAKQILQNLKGKTNLAQVSGKSFPVTFSENIINF